MASEVDALVLMVGYPHDLRSVLLEQDVISKMRPGSLLIDHTTSTPSLAMEIAEIAKSKNIDCLDSPVSGGDIGAKAGKLVLMTGGSQAAFERAQPLFNSYGSVIELLGEAGSGQHTKCCNQITIAGSMIGVCEALIYGHRAGLDLVKLLETIKGGGANSFSLTAYTPRVLRRDMQPGFFVEHFVKDMEIVLDECRRMGISLPGLSLVHQLYRGLMAQGGGKLGTQALVTVLEKLNGIEIKKYDI